MIKPALEAVCTSPCAGAALRIYKSDYGVVTGIVAKSITINESGIITGVVASPVSYPTYGIVTGVVQSNYVLVIKLINNYNRDTRLSDYIEETTIEL